MAANLFFQYTNRLLNIRSSEHIIPVFLRQRGVKCGFTILSTIPYTVSSCMSRLGQINRVKHIFNKHALIIIINALVFSKLFYCSSVWSNTTQTNLDRLQAVQNFACRILSGAKKFDHITPLLKDLRWLPIRQQLYFRFAVLVFK